MIDYLFMLANTNPDGSISEKAVVGIIGAIFTGLGVLAGKFIEKKKQSNEVTVKDQPIGVVKHQQAVTWADHANLVRRVDRVEAHYDELRRDSSEQFKDLLEAASSRESRIVKELHEVARSIHERIDKMNQPRGGAK